MDYQVKIYFLLGVLLTINVIVFILNNLLSVENLPKKVTKVFRHKREKRYLSVKMEDIVDYDYYLIEGCMFTYKKERYGDFSSRKKKS